MVAAIVRQPSDAELSVPAIANGIDEIIGGELLNGPAVLTSPRLPPLDHCAAVKRLPKGCAGLGLRPRHPRDGRPRINRRDRRASRSRRSRDTGCKATSDSLLTPGADSASLSPYWRDRQPSRLRGSA